MGASKTEQFSHEQNHIAQMAKAIAHPARLAILEFLYNQEACFCGDIVNKIGLAQATTSQHLKALKDAGLIIANNTGTKVCYCINKKNFNHLNKVFSRFFKSGCCINCC